MSSSPPPVSPRRSRLPWSGLRHIQGPCCRRVGGRRRPREACNLGRDRREAAEGESCGEAGAPVVRGLRCRARRRASVVWPALVGAAVSSLVRLGVWGSYCSTLSSKCQVSRSEVFLSSSICFSCIYSKSPKGFQSQRLALLINLLCFPWCQ